MVRFAFMIFIVMMADSHLLAQTITITIDKNKTADANENMKPSRLLLLHGIALPARSISTMVIDL